MVKRRNKVITVALILVGIGAAYAVFYRLTGFGIPCVFHLITGLECPGCGSTRMLVSMTKLEFAEAFHYNPAIFCMLPLMTAVAARYIYLYIKYGRIRDKWADRAVWAMIAVLLVFGVLRNIL